LRSNISSFLYNQHHQGKAFPYKEEANSILAKSSPRDDDDNNDSGSPRCCPLRNQLSTLSWMTFSILINLISFLERCSKNLNDNSVCSRTCSNVSFRSYMAHLNEQYTAMISSWLSPRMIRHCLESETPFLEIIQWHHLLLQRDSGFKGTSPSTPCERKSTSRPKCNHSQRTYSNDGRDGGGGTQGVILNVCVALSCSFEQSECHCLSRRK